MKVLITGASSGIGKDFAKLLVHEYDELVLVARDKDRLKKLKDELNKVPDKRIKTVSLDLSDYKNCIELYEDNKDVDLLINNAGFGDCGYFDKTELDKDINMSNTNRTALHTLTKLYLKDMKKNKSGHILNVSSVAGFMPGPLMATYYASKSYVLKLSESIREELRRENSNVKISVLCPGPVKTNFEKSANVKFQISKANSADVASYAIKHLNKFYIIPSFSVRLARFGTKIIPNSILARFVFKVQKRRVK